MSIEESLGPRWKKLERESDIALYKSQRVRKDDYEATFPWYIPSLKEYWEAKLKADGFDVKVSLGKSMATIFLYIDYGNAAYKASLMLPDEEIDMGKPIERTVTSVSRDDKHGVKHKVARLVIEGFSLEQVNLEIGDKCDLYIIPSNESTIGSMKIVPRKRLK